MYRAHEAIVERFGYKMSPETYTQHPFSRANSERSCKKARGHSAVRKWGINSTTPVASSGPPAWVSRMRSLRHSMPTGGEASSGRVWECQLAARYVSLPTTKAVYRERISASAVDAVCSPASRGPQHSA